MSACTHDWGTTAEGTCPNCGAPMPPRLTPQVPSREEQRERIARALAKRAQYVDDWRLFLPAADDVLAAWSPPVPLTRDDAAALLAHMFGPRIDDPVGVMNVLHHEGYRLYRVAPDAEERAR